MRNAFLRPSPPLKPTAPPPHRQATSTAVVGNTGLPDSFVKVKQGRLVVGEQCKELYFAGWNMCAPASAC